MSLEFLNLKDGKMIFKELFVLSLVLISRINGRSIDSPFSYSLYTPQQTHIAYSYQSPVSHMEFRSLHSPISYDLTHPISSVTKPPKMIINVQPITPNVDYAKPTKSTKRAPVKSNQRYSSKLTKRNSSTKSAERKSFKATEDELKSSKLTKRNPMPLQNDDSSENLIRIVRRMRKNYTDTEIRILSTIGLISGALNVEEAMRTNLNRLADEYYDKYNLMSPEHNAKKMLQIEEAINRDKLASSLLNSALKFAREAMNVDDFQKDMKRLMNEVG